MYQPVSNPVEGSNLVFFATRPLGNLSEVSKNLVDVLISIFGLDVVDDEQIRAAHREVFNTLLALRNYSYDKDGRIVEMRLTWSDEDVLEINPTLNADQVSLVLEMLKKNHDANVGVSWDTIEATIDTVCK